MSDLIALVTEVEADVHEQGWDMNPVTFVLCEDDERGLHFELLEMPTFLFNDIGECMEALAEKGVKLADRALGILLVNEAWGLELPVDALNEDGSYTGVRTSESPDRIECRMASLLTRDGRMINGQRERVKDVFQVHEASPEEVAMQMKARFPFLMHALLHGEPPSE